MPRIELERDEAGWWVATALGMQGVHTQGRTIKEALLRLREAIAAAAPTKQRPG